MRVFHRKMELTEFFQSYGIGKAGKIDRSAEALRVSHHSFTFPSKRFSTTRLAGDGAGKKVEHGSQRE
jgi:hypothetical protein